MQQSQHAIDRLERFIAELGREELEDLVGGRLLAWVGGLAVLVGIVFLFALGITSGWLDETARVALGGAMSAALLALGVWLHERRARTDAALAAVATGIAGLFTTITVAAQVYELIPQLPAAALAVGTGAIAMALAVRWESRGIAALGILGGLGAPVLTGVGGDGGTMVILFFALAAAAGVLLWLRWGWLAMGAFLVATPQWVAFLAHTPPATSQLAVLTAFGTLGAAMAVGHDVRVRAERLRSSSAYLLALNAIVVSAAGWAGLEFIAGDGLANAWLAGVALAHLGLGIAAPRLRLSSDLRLLALVIGAVVADFAFGLIADGPALAIGWAATGVGFAALMGRTSASAVEDPAAAVLTQAGLGVHLALSLLSAIATSDPVQVLHGETALSIGGAAAVAALAAGCLVSARVVGERQEAWRMLLDMVGLGAVAVLTAMQLEGMQQALSWAVEAVALAAVARRSRDELAAMGAVCFVALAGTHALVFEAPPVSLVTGLVHPFAAVAALGAVGCCLILMGRWTSDDAPELRTTFTTLGALTLLYLASAVVITPFESDAAVDSVLLSAHQQGQMVLSVFWGLVGVGTVVVGLRRDLRFVRAVGLILLGVTVAKVFVFDLATLTSIYRVVSCVGLGLLLLAGALTWQRLRPRALADLRETPSGVR
jgi:uncharacterized membrane protein